ncbi:MAG: hypothetical protein AAF985_27185 [Bacteroidota bacterium]
MSDHQFISKLITLGIFAFFFCIPSSFSQSKNKSSKSEASQVFLTTSFHFLENPSPFNFDETFFAPFPEMLSHSVERKSIMNVGVAFQKVKPSGWFYELALVKLSIDDDTNVKVRSNEVDPGPGIPIFGDQNLTIDVVSRLEYGKYFFDLKKNKFNLGLSLGIKSHFDYNNLTPRNSNGFPLRFSRVGLVLQVIPILSFQAAKRVLIDLKVFPDLIDFYYQRSRTLNPNLAISQQTDTSFNTTFLDRTSFSLSARYLLK